MDGSFPMDTRMSLFTHNCGNFFFFVCRIQLERRGTRESVEAEEAEDTVLLSQRRTPSLVSFGGCSFFHTVNSATPRVLGHC